MESKYDKILSAEESFAREVALGVSITKPLTVWHYLIPGMFIIDFLKRGSAIKRYSHHFMFPRKLALDAAQTITQGEQKSQRLLEAEQEIKTWLNALNLYSEGLLRIQMTTVDLLVDHYERLLKAEGESYYSLIENAYTNRVNYEAFLSRLTSAENEVDQAIIETLGETENLRVRLAAEKAQVEKQRKKHIDRAFSWTG
ncbi:MAG: NF038143 family protein [Desulfobacterales bacterium]|nr:NF038143 family protein [Pseudomonadota bacterium]MCG2777137.1 NF038143 family protein [Desulfobacterales bacterium]